MNLIPVKFEWPISLSLPFEKEITPGCRKKGIIINVEGIELLCRQGATIKQEWKSLIALEIINIISEETRARSISTLLSLQSSFSRSNGSIEIPGFQLYLKRDSLVFKEKII